MQIEKEALKKENDTASKERLKKLSKELAELQHSFDNLTLQWEKEKSALQDMSGLKQEIEEVRLQIERARQDYNLEEAARLEYGELPELENVLKVTVDKSAVAGDTDPIVTYGKKQSTSVA